MEILQKNGSKVVDLNRRRTIRERCLNCSGWMPSEVSGCTFTDCELYPFRTGRGEQESKARANAIRAYCLWCMAGQRSEVSRCPSRLCPLFAFRKSAVDRSVEVPVLVKKSLIDGSSRAKIKNRPNTLPSDIASERLAV